MLGNTDFAVNLIDVLSSVTRRRQILLPTGTTASDTFSFSGTFDADFSWATPGDTLVREITTRGDTPVTDIFTFAIVPEPATALLTALSSLALLRRKRR